MPFIPIPSAAQVELRGTLSGQQIETVLGFVFDTVPIQDDVDDLCFACNQWWAVDARFFLPPNYVYREVYTRELSALAGMSATTTFGAGTAGFYGSQGLSNNVTMCVSFRTAQTGRSYRGRNYWPLAIEAVNGNTITAAITTDVPEAYEAFFLDPAFGTTPNGKWTWAILSRYNNGAARITGVATPVTRALVVDTIVDSQRRRLPGRGR